MGFFTKLKEKLFNKKVKEEVKSKYVSGLDKSRKNFVDKLAELKARYSKIDEDYFEELEQILILSDVGVNTALNIVEATRQEVKLKGITDPSTINEILVDKMFIAYANNDVVDTEISFDDSGLTVVMVVGVNGVGKTTSIAKLCNRYKNEGKKVAFVIGGSLGLSKAVKERADFKLSISPLTFPHQLLRVILCESIYRALTIINGTKYHK